MKALLRSIFVCGTMLGIAVADDTIQKGPVQVTKVKEPRKELRFQVVIPAPVEQVWQAFTTSEGLMTWLWQDCVVDLREQGDWLVRYPGGKTGGGTILSFKPGREIVMLAMAPEAFPTVRQERTTAAFGFEAVDGKNTRVSLVQSGWKQGEEWDKAYDYLANGNAMLLAQLYKRFVDGPISWMKK
jgi:uncharacterized protein YndB with AHSA1/START domain